MNCNRIAFEPSHRNLAVPETAGADLTIALCYFPSVEDRTTIFIPANSGSMIKKDLFFIECIRKTIQTVGCKPT